LLLLRSLVVAG